jgi:uncharacterized membrane protein
LTTHTTESHARSLIKGISWRIIGTLDTLLVSYLWTGEFHLAMKIAGAEILTKIVLYYFHERAWLYFRKDKEQTHTISAMKGITWRIIGSIDTSLLAWLITGSGYRGLQIGGTEVLTKIFLFYIHERLWLRVPIGTIRRIFPFLDQDK